MVSDDAGSRPFLFMITPNTKRHPNSTKTDQLPISEVITGLPLGRTITTTSYELSWKVKVMIKKKKKVTIPDLHGETPNRL